MWARVQYDRWQDEAEQSRMNKLDSKVEGDGNGHSVNKVLNHQAKPEQNVKGTVEEIRKKNREHERGLISQN